jgi:hypothetical protein
MARYTVTWSPGAEKRLADLWLTATDHDAVTWASNHAEIVLARDPHAVGESRAEDDRIWFIRPLVVYYEVRDADRLVRISDVDLA